MAAGTRGGIAALAGCLLAFGLPGWVAAPAKAQVPVPGAIANPGPQIDNLASDRDSPDDSVGEASAAGEARPFYINAGLGVREIYNSNALGVQNGRSDWMTQGQADLNLHDKTQRFQGDLAYSLVGDYHSDVTELNSIQNYLNAIGHAELVPEHLFLSGRAFAQPTLLSRLGSLDVNGSSATANERNAYGYVFTPDFTWRFGDFLRSDLTATQSGEFFSDLSNSSLGNVLPFAGPQNAVSTTISERLKGGDYFGRLEWMLTGSGTNTSQSGFHQKKRSGEADLEYHVDHSFGIIANVGYRQYETRPALTRGISGIIAMGGFTFEPNPTFALVFKAGKQYNFTSFTGNLRYQFTAASALLVTVDDTITTPQDRLLLGLNGLDVSQGQFFLPTTNLPVDFSPPGLPVTGGLPVTNGQPINVTPLDGLALDNIISRYRTATAGLVHKMSRTTLSLTGYGTVRDYLLPLPGFDSRQTIYGMDLSATRDLTRDFSATLAGDYSVAHEFGGIDKLATFSAFLNYYISPNWSGNLQVSYIGRDARTPIAFANGAVSDVQVGLGMHYNF
jgi:uncharacterized protein (PEP-CTERM system associated)